MRPFCVLLLAAWLLSAELPLAGAWVGEKPTLPADGTVVLAMYDRAGTCCGGPAAALAGLGNLRQALTGRAGVRLVAVDVTVGGSADQAREAAALHRIDDLPLLVDAERGTAKALGATIDMTMTYIIVRADGAQETVHSPAAVRRSLGL